MVICQVLNSPENRSQRSPLMFSGMPCSTSSLVFSVRYIHNPWPYSAKWFFQACSFRNSLAWMHLRERMTSSEVFRRACERGFSVCQVYAGKNLTSILLTQILSNTLVSGWHYICLSYMLILIQHWKNSKQLTEKRFLCLNLQTLFTWVSCHVLCYFNYSKPHWL